MSNLSHICLFILGWVLAVILMPFAADMYNDRMTDDEIYANTLETIDWLQVVLGNKSLSDLHVHMNNNEVWVKNLIRAKREAVCGG